MLYPVVTPYFGTKHSKCCLNPYREQLVSFITTEMPEDRAVCESFCIPWSRVLSMIRTSSSTQILWRSTNSGWIRWRLRLAKPGKACKCLVSVPLWRVSNFLGFWFSSGLPYEVSMEQALQHDEVRARIQQSVDQLQTVTETFLSAILNSINSIPWVLGSCSFLLASLNLYFDLILYISNYLVMVWGTWLRFSEMLSLPSSLVCQRKMSWRWHFPYKDSVIPISILNINLALWKAWLLYLWVLYACRLWETWYITAISILPSWLPMPLTSWKLVQAGHWPMTSAETWAPLPRSYNLLLPTKGSVEFGLIL